MPIIPDYEERVLPNSPDLAEIQPGRFGRDAEALTRVGGQVAQLGSNLMYARKKAEEEDAIYTANQSDIEWLSKTSEQVRQEFTTMGPNNQIIINEQGYAERIKELSDERLEENMDAMPTGDAQRGYLATSGRMFGQAYVRNMTEENIERVKIFSKNFDQSMNGQIIQLGLQPSDFSLSKSIQSAGNWINESPASPLNGSEKIHLFKLKGREAVMSYFDGLSRSKAGAQNGLMMIQSMQAVGGSPVKTAWTEDGKIQTHDFAISGDNTYLMNFLDGKDVEHLRDKLGSAVKQRNNIELRGVKSDLKDVTDQMTSGQWDMKIQQNADSYIGNLRTMVSEDGPYTMRDWQEDVVVANTAKVSAQFMQVAASLPAGSKGAADIKIDSFINDALLQSGVPEEKREQFSFRLRESFAKHRDQLFDKLVKERNTDPVGYLRKYKIGGGEVSLMGGNASGNGIQQLLAAQRQLGVSQQNQRLLSNAEAKGIAKSIQDAQNPDAAAQSLLSINNQMGKYAKKYMDELVKHGKLDENYRSVTYVENDEYAKNAVESIKNKDAANALFQLGRKEDEDSLQEEVNSQYKSYFGAIAGAGPYAKNTELAMAIKKNVAYGARQMMVRENMDASDAVEKSMDRAIKTSYDLRKNTLVPRIIGGQQIDPRLVEGEMNWLGSRQYLEQIAKVPGGAPNSADRFWKAIGNSKWNINAEQSGVTLQIKNNQGAWIDVLNKNNQPITVDFIEATKSTSDQGLKLAPRE